ncbi:hypothetical protein [Actinoallomurus sp. CA-142502]|uniref:hypothetical protein n=1 Tax=Actinoallomurus sp. CA-142502 TaxID=3239885 RepID=UPI003D8CE8D5
MKPIRLLARVIGVAAMAVAVGTAVNQILNGGRWNWWALAAALTLATLAEGVNRWLVRSDVRDEQIRPTLWPTLTAPDESPRRLTEVTPRDLGVHPNRFGPEGEALYIPRDVDDALDEALTGGRRPIVVVAGPRLAGTTSTLAQAAQSQLPDHYVLGFVDDPRVRLTDMIECSRRWAGHGPGAVLWLDGLTPDRFTELALLPADRLPDGLRVLATIDTGELEGLRIPEYQVKALEEHAVQVELGVLTRTERAELRAQDTYAGLRPVLDEDADVLMGRLMVAWEQIHDALTPAGEETTDRVALLHAVTDWYRARLPRLLTTDVLTHLYGAYRREPAGQSVIAPASAAGYARALEWATAVRPDRPRLIDVQTVAGAGGTLRTRC